jgi:hypothetical protein
MEYVLWVSQCLLAATAMEKEIGKRFFQVVIAAAALLLLCPSS